MLSALLLLACTAAPPAQTAPGQNRWVSLSPSITEILFSVGAGPEVVGVCSPSTYPPEAETLPAVASWDRLDVEGVLALAPSACFTVEGMQAPQSLESLGRLHVEVVAYPMRSLGDLWTCMEDVGERTGHGERARQVVSLLKTRVARAGSGLTGSPRRALVVVGLDPLVAAGSGSFLSQVLRAAGYENALTGAGDAYPVLSMEAAAAARPEAVVFPEGEIPPGDCARFIEDLRRLTDRPLQSIAIPADLLVRPGPRTADAVERLAEARREGTGSGEGGAGSGAIANCELRIANGEKRRDQERGAGENRSGLSVIGDRFLTENRRPATDKDLHQVSSSPHHGNPGAAYRGRMGHRERPQAQWLSLRGGRRPTRQSRYPGSHAEIASLPCRAPRNDGVNVLRLASFSIASRHTRPEASLDLA